MFHSSSFLCLLHFFICEQWCDSSVVSVYSVHKASGRTSPDPSWSKTEAFCQVTSKASVSDQQGPEDILKQTKRRHTVPTVKHGSGLVLFWGCFVCVSTCVLFVLEFCPSVLLRGKALNNPLIEVRNVSDEFFLHGEHGQSIQAILRHGVPQECFDSL